MWIQKLRSRYQQAPSGLRFTLWLAGSLVAGLTLLPALIYAIGSTALGRYEGASLPNLYGSVYRGAFEGNWASWGVILGPALLLVLGRGLLAWWRRSANLIA